MHSLYVFYTKPLHRYVPSKEMYMAEQALAHSATVFNPLAKKENFNNKMDGNSELKSKQVDFKNWLELLFSNF